MLLTRALVEWTGLNEGLVVHDDERRYLERIGWKHERRLQVLEEQAAKFGAHTAPHIITEIEDIRGKITDIDRQLDGQKAL